MIPIDLTLPTGWTLGYVAAMLRVAAFVTSTPFLNRRMPLPGRIAFVLAVSLALAVPLPATDFGGLLAMAAANIAIGLLIGFVTGIVFQAFFSAGTVTDVLAGLGIGASFDPVTGAQASVFDRVFDLTALTVFMVVGGDHLMLSALDASTSVLPLDGTIEISSGLQGIVTEQLSILVLGAVQIAAPAIAALFLAEIVLGISARLLPQANVFLVGLPLKLLLGILAGTAVVLGMPTMVEWFIDHTEDLLRTLFSGIREGT
ncbi:MAG: flagellar biosynthetic protein FliR [Actinomycetota bacterium]